MSLVSVDEGAIRACKLLAQGWPTYRYVGLYQNEVTIDRHVTIDKLEDCDFSGYVGRQKIEAWGPADFVGDRAVSYAAPLTWEYDGGDPSGWVVGYYVVDEDGVLLWVEERPEGPVAMVQGGQFFQVTPSLSVGTRYGGTT